MNKKILVFGVLAAMLLVTISFASAVTTQTQNKKKESPLFGIRTKLAIGERIQNLKAKFFGERIFFIPFHLLIKRANWYNMGWTELSVNCWDSVACGGKC